jgi:hypothetical protein
MCEPVAIGAYAMPNYGTSLTKKAKKVQDETGYQWVQRHLRDSENCYDMFRIRSVFYMLHDELIDKYGLRSSNEMCSIEALGMCFMDVWCISVSSPSKTHFHSF